MTGRSSKIDPAALQLLLQIAETENGEITAAVLNSGFASISLTLMAFCFSAQASASLPLTSSSQRFGSSTFSGGGGLQRLRHGDDSGTLDHGGLDDRLMW